MALGAEGLASFVKDHFRPELLMKLEEGVDLVGHSSGGLVARYYVERLDASADGPIGSINMLGTPNDGVWLGQVEKYMCPGGKKLFGFSLCVPKKVFEVSHLFSFEAVSQGVTDVIPGSALLDELNAGFALPELPVYRARAGLHPTLGGHISSGSHDNDCVVSLRSVDGPNGVFRPVRTRYDGVTHGAGGLRGCDSPTLLNDLSVVLDLAVTIRGGANVGLATEEPLVEPTEEEEGSVEAALTSTLLDLVQPGQSNTHEINVPGDLEAASFVVFWLDDNDPQPDLELTLKRPDDTIVGENDPDVIEKLTPSGTEAFGTLMAGFVMNAPQAGNWEISVEGVSTPDEGQLYLMVLMPDSHVVLSSNVTGPYIAQSQPQVITATLFDGATPIAVSDISAEVTTPGGDEITVTLRDDGTGGDEVAEDLIYSGSFNSTADCGGYGVYATATADSSEGTVTREQVGFFQAHLPGDAIRDPCNADEDEDGLTDADEVNVVGTDPLEPDTDGDGMPDGYEAAHACLNPLVDDAAGDPDGDGLSNLAEYNRYSDPCSAVAVGGIQALPDTAELALERAQSSHASSRPYAATAAVAVGVVLLGASAWYAKRRWLAG